MIDYVVRIQFHVLEEYEFEVRAADEAKAEKALLAYVKDISRIDPWKIRKFDIQDTKVLSVVDKRLAPKPKLAFPGKEKSHVQVERNTAPVGEKKKRQRKSSQV